MAVTALWKKFVNKRKRAGPRIYQEFAPKRWTNRFLLFLAMLPMLPRCNLQVIPVFTHTAQKYPMLKMTRCLDKKYYNLIPIFDKKTLMDVEIAREPELKRQCTQKLCQCYELWMHRRYHTAVHARLEVRVVPCTSHECPSAPRRCTVRQPRTWATRGRVRDVVEGTVEMIRHWYLVLL